MACWNRFPENCIKPTIAAAVASATIIPRSHARDFSLRADASMRTVAGTISEKNAFKVTPGATAIGRHGWASPDIWLASIIHPCPGSACQTVGGKGTSWISGTIAIAANTIMGLRLSVEGRGAHKITTTMKSHAVASTSGCPATSMRDEPPTHHSTANMANSSTKNTSVKVRCNPDKRADMLRQSASGKRLGSLPCLGVPESR